MMRSFDWRDVGVVRTLGGQGVCLDSETGLIHGHHPLQSALLAYLMPGQNAPTIVWRDHQHAAFGQFRHRLGHELAWILFVAPACAQAGAGWLPIMEQLSVEAGGRGAYNLIAEVSEASGEFEALRAAGFAVYARQTLWKLTDIAGPAQTTVALRPAVSADEFSVNTLYTNIVPRLIQQVEPAPRHRHGYVLEQGGELIAFLDVRRGPLGIWVEPYLHPAAYELSEMVVNAARNRLPPANTRPLYVCVRRYQDWLQDILMHAGFTLIDSQAVMVKRLAARVMEPQLKPLPALEGKAPTPVVRLEYEHKKD